MKQIPMLDLRAEYLYMKADIDASIAKCLDHQKWILGPEVKELETGIAKYLGAGHCVGTSSGTEALVLALRAQAIKRKGQEYFDRSDEIITTPFTFTATGDTIVRAGATPVFVDIDPDTFNISVDGIRKYLRENGSRVVGIVPVHLFGQACEMDQIMELAAEYKLFVLEDVAQGFGGSWKGKKLGAIGAAGAFSFFPSKNLGGFGDAGMASTNDGELAEIMRMLLKHGGKDKYNVDHIGYNARLDTLQAAVLMAKLKYLDEFNEKRRAIAGAYESGLKGVPGIVVPKGKDSANGVHVFHQYTLKTPERDKLQAFLKGYGIDSMVYYPFALHKMKVFAGRCKVYGNLAHSEEACANVLSLPIEPLQSVEDTNFIIGKIREFKSAK